MYIQGNATRLKIKNTAYDIDTTLAGETKCTVQMSMKSHTVASFEEMSWEHIDTDLSSWRVTASGQLTNESAVMTYLVISIDEPATVSFCIGNKTLTGKAIPTSVKVTGKVKGKSEWSVTLQGSGVLIVS